jgi:hypothetical protein
MGVLNFALGPAALLELAVAHRPGHPLVTGSQLIELAEQRGCTTNGADRVRRLSDDDQPPHRP